MLEAVSTGEVNIRHNDVNTKQRAVTRYESRLGVTRRKLTRALFATRTNTTCKSETRFNTAKGNTAHAIGRPFTFSRHDLANWKVTVAAKCRLLHNSNRWLLST